jgi:GT2 family glycosyltransferase
MTAYHHAPGVEPATFNGRAVLALPRNGRVAIDDDVLAIWTAAHGRSFDEVLRTWRDEPSRPDFVPAALACLVEGGLLRRDMTRPVSAVEDAAGNQPLVSAIIISYDSLEWLNGSIGTLLAQRYPAIEPIVVDNGSPIDPTPWIAQHFPAVRVIRVDPGRTFAHAVNQGVAISSGLYALVLNPDIEMAPDVTARLVLAAEADPGCAAVAAKLTFWWAPGFLNGLGNRVEATSWGTDNFIGHLDLGQFDDCREVPSVCFAAALIRRAAWDSTGGADEGFPLYYEDTEWSYRARLLGHRILAAPNAVVQHVFGGKVRSAAESDLTARKILNAAYGRLRFALKLLSGETRRIFVRNYFAEDRANAGAALACGDWGVARAYARAWSFAARDLRSIALSRRSLLAARCLSDAELFAGQANMPSGRLWHGMPDLSRSVIMRDYLPLLTGGRTRPMPEFARRAVRAS